MKTMIELKCSFCEEPFEKIKGNYDFAVKNGQSVFFHSALCASKWRSTHMLGTNHPKFKGEFKTYRDRAIREYGHACTRCGYSLIVDVHHIDGNHQNNELSNLDVLCPNCHREVTTGYWSY